MTSATTARGQSRTGILTPIPRQVFQRGASDTARVPVRVGASAGVDAVEARVVRHECREVLVDWIPLQSAGAGEFEGAFELPSGGWYVLQTRERTAAGVFVREEAVERIGVGEVFICAGQSNAANSGQTPMKSLDDRVSSFDGVHWTPCEDPQRGANGEGGSPWPVLGDLLARNLDMPVAFASVAVGGTSVNFWQPGEDGYERLQRAALALGVKGARAVLWHQGESDALGGMPTEQYVQRLTNTITRIREDAGYDLPWFVAKVSFCPDHWDEHPEMRDAIRSAQQALWDAGTALQGPDTDALRAPHYRSEDRIHFSELGLRVHAERWFAMLWSRLFE